MYAYSLSCVSAVLYPSKNCNLLNCPTRSLWTLSMSTFCLCGCIILSWYESVTLYQVFLRNMRFMSCSILCCVILLHLYLSNRSRSVCVCVLVCVCALLACCFYNWSVLWANRKYKFTFVSAYLLQTSCFSAVIEHVNNLNKMTSHNTISMCLRTTCQSIQTHVPLH